MGGEDHLVEGLGMAAADHLDPAGRAADRVDGGRE
jgi:hypothetical protein